MKSKIRPAVPDDVPDIARVKAAVWDESGDVAHMARVIESPNHRTWVAVAAGRVVGFVDGFLTQTAEGDPRWEVDLLAVHPAYRQRGFARRLVEASTASGRERNAILARALVQIGNRGSQRTFARCGYQLDDTVHALLVASTPAARPAHPPTSAHLIPVHTLNYTGIWLEGDVTPDAIAAAQSQCERAGLDLTGVVLPAAQQEAITALRTSGFEHLDTYQRWRRVP